MKVIEIPDIPLPSGHYSKCIELNGLLYLSGQLPLNPETSHIPSTIEAQTTLALKNVESILKAAGSNKNCVIQTRIYVSNINLWDKVNKAYSNFFESHKPVRSIVPTGKLHFGCLIEIEVIATTNN